LRCNGQSIICAFEGYVVVDRAAVGPIGDEAEPGRRLDRTLGRVGHDKDRTIMRLDPTLDSRKKPSY
jgi:hypothetical protein